MTLFFRDLARVDPRAPSPAPLEDAYYQPSQLTPAYRERLNAWLRRYAKRVLRDGRPDAVRIAQMNSTNPRYVLRNYLAQLAIDKAEAGDTTMVDELLDVMRAVPYDEQPRPRAIRRPSAPTGHVNDPVAPCCPAVHRIPVRSPVWTLITALAMVATVTPAQPNETDPTPMDRMIDEIQADARRTGLYTGRMQISAPVIDALRDTPREDFVPRRTRSLAYANHPLPIGHGQTISQPFIVAIMTDVLNVESHHRRIGDRHRVRLPGCGLVALGRGGVQHRDRAGVGNRGPRAAQDARLRQRRCPDRRWLVRVARACAIRRGDRDGGGGRDSTGVGRTTDRRRPPRHAGGRYGRVPGGLIVYSKRDGETTTLFPVRFVPLTGDH